MTSSKVKSMISIYENFSYNNEPFKLSQITKTKSTGNITVAVNKSQENKSQSESNLDLVHIDHQIQYLNNNLINYKTYSRENHISYQNQILFLFSDIINLDAKGDIHVINKKSQMAESLKRLNTGLNAKLPFNTNYALPNVTKKMIEEPDVVTDRLQYSPPAKQYREVEVFATVAPSVKKLKQLWENNIQNEKQKLQDNRAGVKDTRVVLRRFQMEDKYVPYTQRFKALSSEYTNHFDSDSYENSIPMQRTSGEITDDELECPRNLLVEDHSSHNSEISSDRDSDTQY